MVALIAASLLVGGSLALAVLSNGNTADGSTVAGGSGPSAGSHTARGTLGQHAAGTRTGVEHSPPGRGAMANHLIYFPLLVSSPDH